MIPPGTPQAPRDEEYLLGPPLDDAASIVWRKERLLMLGVCEALAELAAETRADWHIVADLVAKGCDPNLAVGIAL